MDLKQDIIVIYHNSRKTYGSPRIQQTLLREGYHISKKRVEKLMREAGIYAVAKKNTELLPILSTHFQWQQTL